MTKRYKKMCEVYKIFAEGWDCDLSNEAMLEMFEFETFGRGNLKEDLFIGYKRKINGYKLGKKWLNVQVSA